MHFFPFQIYKLSFFKQNYVDFWQIVGSSKTQKMKTHACSLSHKQQIAIKLHAIFFVQPNSGTRFAVQNNSRTYFFQSNCRRFILKPNTRRRFIVKLRTVVLFQPRYHTKSRKLPFVTFYTRNTWKTFFSCLKSIEHGLLIIRGLD